MKLIKRIVIVLISLIVILLGTGITIAIIYEDEIVQAVVEDLNQYINTKVDVKSVHFSVIRQFPHASVEFKNLFIHSPKDYLDIHPKSDTLLFAEHFFLEFSLWDVIQEKYILKQAQLKNATVRMEIDQKGRDNFHITQSNDSSSTSFSIDLNKIKFINVGYRFTNFKNNSIYDAETDVLSLSGNFKDESFGLNSKGQLFLNQIQIDGINYLIQRKTPLKFESNINSKSINIEEGELWIGKAKLMLEGQFQYKEKAHLDIIAASNAIRIETLFEHLPGNIKNNLNHYQSTGDAAFEVKISGDVGQNQVPQINIRSSIKNAELANVKSDLSLTNINLELRYESGSNHLQLQQFSAQLAESRFKGQLNIDNIKHPDIDAHVNVNSDLKELKRFFEIDSLKTLSGHVNANIKFTGRLLSSDTITPLDIKTFKTDGEIRLTNAFVDFPDKFKQALSNINANLRMDNNNIFIDSLLFKSGRSKIDIQGKAYNVLSFLLLENEELRLNGNLHCDTLNMAELIVKSSKEDDDIKAFNYPKFITARLQVAIDEFEYNQFKAENVYAQFYINNQIAEVSDFRLKHQNGTAIGALSLIPKSDKVYSLEMNANLQNIDMQILMQQMENFGQSSIKSENISGELNASILIKSELDSFFKIDKKNLEALAKINIKKGALHQYKPLYKLSKFVELSDLEEIQFDDLENELWIKNESLIIPLMQIKNNAVNLTVSGEHKFNNHYRYHLNILLSEILGKKARANKAENNEFGVVEDDGYGRTSLFLIIEGDGDKTNIKYDTESVKNHIKEGFKEEKQDLKSLLNEEFGLFKKDSTLKKKTEEKKSTKSQFQIEWEDQ
ncbi:MAG: hypothetical protein JXR60_09605 [Bacteroidales bacterium]|nr:hypothetical protein [Bacteroidales bacterium]